MSVIEGQGLPGTPTQTVLTVQGHPDGLPLLVNLVAGPNGTALPTYYAFSNVASGSADAILVAASSGKAVRVIALVVQCGAKATGITFNSKSAGAGTPITAALQYAANGGQVWPENRSGWFQTKSGEGLTATTTASAVATAVQLVYLLV